MDYLLILLTLFAGFLLGFVVAGAIHDCKREDERIRKALDALGD